MPRFSADTYGVSVSILLFSVQTIFVHVLTAKLRGGSSEPPRFRRNRRCNPTANRCRAAAMWSAAVLATVVTASLLAANPAKAANVHHMSDHDGARGEKSFHDLAAAWRADSPAFAQLRRAGGWAPTACGFGGANIITTYGKQVDPASVLPEYPRPQMVRAPAAAAAGTPMAATAAESALLSLDGAAVGAAAAMRELSGRMPTTNDGWLNLNGLWEFEFASSTAAADAPFGPPEPRFGQPLNGTILVPFPAEACLSGVGKTGTQLRYRTVFDAPLWPAGVVSALGGEVSHLLHFGSVDWQTEVYLNGQLVANHTGGYDGFSTGDLTSLLKPSGNELLVNVFDPSDTGVQPNGKQRISAIIHPGGDTYTPSSGIWQTVWLEAVPKVHISTLKLRTTTTLLNATVFVDRDTANDDVTATVSLLDESGKAIATGSAAAGTQISIDVSGAGVKLWSDTSPNLYNVSVSITGGDSVLSYVGFREFNLVDVPVHFDNGPQPGVDRPGGDMPGYPVQMPSADPDWCWARCNATSGCEAWATSVPGCDQYKEPMCWLKSSLPSPTSNKCRVSGVEAGSGGTVKQPHLNGAARFMAGWLDQSFWPDGLYTAPTTEGLEFDVAAVKTFGLNMVRLHQKVNPERWCVTWPRLTGGCAPLADSSLGVLQVLQGRHDGRHSLSRHAAEVRRRNAGAAAVLQRRLAGHDAGPGRQPPVWCVLSQRSHWVCNAAHMQLSCAPQSFNGRCGIERAHYVSNVANASRLLSLVALCRCSTKETASLSSTQRTWLRWLERSIRRD